MATEAAAIISVSAAQVQVLESKRSKLLERAESLVIDGIEAEQVGWAIVNGIGELRKMIEADFADSKKAAHAAWKAICAQEAGHLEKLKEPDTIVRGKLAAWETEKRRMQAEAERKAREAAEAERKRLQAEADERARVEQERLRKDAEEKRLQEAIEAERQGKAEVAAAILEQPVIVPQVIATPVITPAVVVPAMVTAKAEGAGSMVEVWKYRVVNEQQIPREYLMVNESALQKVVTALKGNARITGVEVFSTLEPRRAGRRA